MRTRSDALADVLGGLVFVALASTLVARREAAREIEATGQYYSQMMRVAAGKPPEPGPEEIIERTFARWDGDSQTLPALEAELDVELGLRRARSRLSLYERLTHKRSTWWADGAPSSD